MLNIFNIQKNPNILKVLQLLIIKPTTKFSIREIGKELKLSAPTVSRAIKILHKMGYVKKTKVGLSMQVCANLENEEFVYFKRVYNLWLLREVRVRLIREFNHPQAIIVYGSYANGEDIERSDIDIALISKTKKKLDLGELEKQLERRIHLMTFDSWQTVPKELRASILNGIKLYGVIDVEV